MISGRQGTEAHHPLPAVLQGPWSTAGPTHSGMAVSAIPLCCKVHRLAPGIASNVREAQGAVLRQVAEERLQGWLQWAEDSQEGGNGSGAAPQVRPHPCAALCCSIPFI